MANRRGRDSFDGDRINGLDHVDPSNGDEGDGDLLLQQTNNNGERLLKWLQALDMQYTGACRADERLKPLLKINASCEDPLLTQLIQHFEPSEFGMLARCFFVPLVSIRVGKIIKEGTRMCPTDNRVCGRGTTSSVRILKKRRSSKPKTSTTTKNHPIIHIHWIDCWVWQCQDFWVLYSSSFTVDR